MYYPKKGYTLVFGREVDVRDENGKVKIDKDALIEVLTSKGIDKDAFDTDKFVYNVENHLGGYHLKFDE